MTSIYNSWASRYKIIEDITEKITLPFSEKIKIKQYIAEDQALKKFVLLKKIDVNENPEIKELAQYLWHYEISLNQRALNISEGKTLLKLIDGEYDKEENCFILVTETCGLSLKNILIAEEDNEDIDSFEKLKKSPFSKKKLWEGLLKLCEGVLALHNAGLLHRNISLDTVYFDSEAYIEGESHFFKLGDFNWSIYLYSISNLISGEISMEIIQNNLHFFRAPECLEIETFKSDIFSFGLMIAFLLNDLDFEKYESSDFSDRIGLYNEIRDIIQRNKGMIKEKEIILKAIEINPDDRYESVEEFTEVIRDFVNELKSNIVHQNQLPVHFRLDRESYFLQNIARKVEINIQGIRSAPNDFLRNEFSDTSLFLTKSKNWPLWAKGKNGKYKFKKAYKARKLADIAVLNKREERELGLTNEVVCKVDKLYWQDPKEKVYSIWDQIFANSLSQIREIDEEPTEYELQKKNWLEAINLITEAEEEIEKRNIFEYELISDSVDNETNKETPRQIVLNIYNNPDRESFSEVLRNSQKRSVELSESPNLRQKFREKRKWKYIDIVDIADDYNTIVKFEENRKNDTPPKSGFLRFWDLRSTLFLLKRKRIIIQELENNDYLIDAILNPAVTHKYFSRDQSSGIVKFIFYTFPIFLLQGPPGTGKTWTAKELIKLTLEKDPYKRILVSSKEHANLDDLLKKTYKMCEELEITPKPIIVRLISTERERNYSPTSIPFQHFPKQIALRMIDNISNWNKEGNEYNDLKKYINDIVSNVGGAPSREWIEIIRESANIVFCTSTANDLRELASASPNFDLVIVEEAGKTYPSELFRPLELGNKWVLIGDQNQLPPFRLNEIVDLVNEKLDEHEVRIQDKSNFSEREFLEFRKLVIREVKIFQSMFERFSEIEPSYDRTDKRKSCDMLIDQYRLPSKISRLISSVFYEKEFNQKVQDKNDLIIEPRYLAGNQLIWINTKNDKKFREKRSGTDLFNISEAKLVANLLKQIKINSKYNKFTIAILTPYKEQVNILKTHLPQQYDNLKGVNIRDVCYTIDSFQGQEADIVIISLVRNNNKETPHAAWGFIPEPQRLNVMLSRAKKVEIIVGDYDLCNIHKKSPFMDKFALVAEFFKKEGKIIDFDEAML